MLITLRAERVNFTLTVIKSIKQIRHVVCSRSKIENTVCE